MLNVQHGFEPVIFTECDTNRNQVIDKMSCHSLRVTVTSSSDKNSDEELEREGFCSLLIHVHGQSSYSRDIFNYDIPVIEIITVL